MGPFDYQPFRPSWRRRPHPVVLWHLGSMVVHAVVWLLAVLGFLALLGLADYLL